MILSSWSRTSHVATAEDTPAENHETVSVFFISENPEANQAVQSTPLRGDSDRQRWQYATPQRLIAHSTTDQVPRPSTVSGHLPRDRTAVDLPQSGTSSTAKREVI